MNRLLACVIALGMAGSAAAEEGRPLKMEVIDQVIEQADRAVQSCHSGSRRSTLAVMMHLSIDSDGRVVTAEAAGKSTHEAHCLARVAKRLKFPSTGVTTSVQYPFMLLPHIRR